MSTLSPAERLGASQANSMGRVFLVEGTAQTKGWSTDRAGHVSRMPELLEQGGGTGEVGKGWSVEGPEGPSDVCMFS